MRQKKGFTLIELIVILVILAILAVAALPTFTGYIDFAKEKLCESRRGQILRAFQAACVDHPDLAAAKDTIELKAATGNKDPLDYLDEIGAYSGDVTCARYHVKYEMIVATNGAGVRTVQLQCPCQGDSALSYLQQAEKIYKNGSASADRKVIIQKLYEERGSLLEVSDSYKKNTYFKDMTLYWRPYYLNDAQKTMVMYASPINDSGWAGWKASLIYYNGTIYQCQKKKWDGTPDDSPISSWSEIGSESKPQTFEEWLVGQPFEKVS